MTLKRNKRLVNQCVGLSTIHGCIAPTECHIRPKSCCDWIILIIVDGIGRQSLDTMPTKVRRKNPSTYPFFYLFMIALGASIVALIIVYIRKRRVYLPRHVAQTNAYLQMAPAVAANHHSWAFEHRPSRRTENEAALLFSMRQDHVSKPM